MSPTQLSLRHLRREGWSCFPCEKYNHHVKRRIDAFGFGDILAFVGDTVALVQTTTTGHMADRIAKIKTLPDAWLWNSAPTRKIIVHGWAKRGPRGKRKVWTLSWEVMQAFEFPGTSF